MNDNPYAPPTAPVYDVPEQPVTIGERPRQVVLAIRLALVNYALGLTALAFSWSYYSQLQSARTLIFNQLVGLIFTLWIYTKIRAGRNWARVTLLVISVLFVAITATPTAVKILRPAPVVAKAQFVVGLGITFTILWLLFVSPGRLWFRKRITA